MPNKLSQLMLSVGICSLLLVTACSAGPAEPQDIAAEAQSVPAATATAAPTPAPTATPVAPAPAPTRTLPTEIIEEPVSPVAPNQVPMPDQLPNNAPAGSETAVKAAIEDLIKQTGLSAGQITVVAVEAVDWNDSSLGCPQEGFMYAQVITPGYLIKLEAQGQPYEYHTDQGKTVVLCQQ